MQGLNVTQTRSLDREIPFDSVGEDPLCGTDQYGHRIVPVMYTLPGSQTTTSFRTGRKLSFREESEQFAQVTADIKHQPSSPFDTGHEFFTVKNTVSLSHQNVRVYDPDSLARYHGPLIPVPFGPRIQFEQLPKMSQNDINYYGALAIENTAPNKAAANVATTIGETIFDGLPRLIGTIAIAGMSSKAAFFRSLGSEYLNSTFGWAPFIRDIVNTVEAVSHANKIVLQLLRDNGRRVRRRYGFAPDIETTSSSDEFFGYLHNLQPFQLSGLYQSYYPYGLISRTKTVTKRTWFSGEYTYHLDLAAMASSEWIRYEKFANKLLGTRVTPEVLWELAPWSWLVDWKANVGAVVSNYTRFKDDSLVLRYGYLMHETRVSDRYTFNGSKFKSPVLNAPSISYNVVQKERYRATPYGFGLDPSALSDSQWATLVALGLSRGPKP